MVGAMVDKCRNLEDLRMGYTDVRAICYCTEPCQLPNIIVRAVSDRGGHIRGCRQAEET